jgi:Kef-type K+ transport system membrane component KefB
MSIALFQLSIVILIATGLGIVAHWFRQPTILAYLATGVLVGFFGFFQLGDTETFRLLSDLGIMFLLFLVGLEVNYDAVRLFGKTSVIIGIGQILVTFLFGFGISYVLGFSPLAASYISIALTFSSTIVVIKLLGDKRELNSLYGRISIGFLLVQDIIAVVLLVALSGISADGTIQLVPMVMALVKGVVLFGVTLYLGRKFFPIVFDTIARSSELLFISSIAWVFLLAAVVHRIGFSIEIAGFLAGVALANSSENFQIASRVRPLRDFFIVIFFVLLGASLVASYGAGHNDAIVVLSLFVLIGNPLILLIIMGAMGYRRRTSFLAGITVAQISEFSLVLMARGLALGHIPESAVATVTAVGIVTMICSSYLIMHGDKIFDYIGKFLTVFERENAFEEGLLAEPKHKQIVLIGCHRIGQGIAWNLPKQHYLVVDFDPEIYKKLSREGVDCLFGDIRDEEIFEKANIAEARLVISTSPSFEDNAALLGRIANLTTRKMKVIVRAETEAEAELLYGIGADYVLLPHLTSGNYLGKAIAVDPYLTILDQLKKRDIQFMRTLREIG